MASQTPTENGATTSASKSEFPICSSCGSARIVRDAWAQWNADMWTWELNAVYDHSFCLECEMEAPMEWRTTPLPRSERIARLNDLLRQGRAASGKVLVTSGVQALGSAFMAKVRHEIAAFADFSPDNDPHNEHDFGSLEIDGSKLFFKIDYYAPDMQQGSEDPANPQQTVRVLTIMLAQEY
jgi:hypothetical protein